MISMQYSNSRGHGCDPAVSCYRTLAIEQLMGFMHKIIVVWKNLVVQKLAHFNSRSDNVCLSYLIAVTYQMVGGIRSGFVV